MEYEVVVGLEVHAELCTKSKIFCGCENAFGREVNTNCCPVCMALPGTLPSLNEKVVEYAIKMGCATNCKINNISRQDRKNYFYPDLPKAYQITQNDIPLCENGYIELPLEGKEKKVRINRIHIEEDSGKLIHDNSLTGTLVDFNRAGVPLIEIVSEPDISGAGEAKAYLESIRSILIYLGISDGKMQEGSIRCDVNVSLKEKGSDTLGVRCEMKNINTFSGVVRSIEYEIERQLKILTSGGKIERQTRRWDDNKGESFLLRSKEEVSDYRYFPEPDLYYINIDKNKIDEIIKSIGELPNKKIIRYSKEYNLSQNESTLLVNDIYKSKLFESAVSFGAKNAKLICNWILGEISFYVNENNISFSELELSPKKLYDLTEFIDNGEISNSSAKKVLSELFKSDLEVEEIITKNGLEQISDTDQLKEIVKKVIEENEKSILDYKSGKTNAFGYLVGQCMKLSKGNGNPSIFKDILIKYIQDK